MSKVAILGSGQLGMMLGRDANKMDPKVECQIIAPDTSGCASLFIPTNVVDFSDNAAVVDAVKNADVVTYEFENVPQSAVEAIEKAGNIVHPCSRALKTGRDRVGEKQIFGRCNIPCATYCNVSPTTLEGVAAWLGYPFVIKSRFGGYDGKGQAIISGVSDLTAPRTIELLTVDCIAEKFIPFSYEVSLIGVRSVAGDVRFYRLVRNYHIGGILQLSLSRWACWTPALQEKAQKYASRIMNDLNYVGVMAIEFFVAKYGEDLVANELAPRVHNSGHWTIEGAETSQFENHIRAILDMPLGSTRLKGCSAMINLIGKVPGDLLLLDGLHGVHFHNYFKQEREGRKVGHVTVVRPELIETIHAARRVGQIFGIDLPML